MFPVILLLLLFGTLAADEFTVDPPLIWREGCPPCRAPAPPPPLLICPDEDNVVVDLRDPIYVDGVLMTESGGVLTAPYMRVQAQKISYTRNLGGENPAFNVTCEGNLIIDYKEWVLVGEKLYYDFLNNQGYILCGRTASPPWYVGGKEMLLTKEGNIVVIDGYVTTSEGECKDVALRAGSICLTPNHVLTASNIQFQIEGVPFFWVPKLSLKLEGIERSPFGVQFGYRGFTGSYISLLYHFLSWNDFNAVARLDGYLNQGVGFGIETAFNPTWRATEWYSRNYYAYDIPLDDPERRNRYRFEGSFFDRYFGVTVDGHYDIVSDPQMAANYQTYDFDLYSTRDTEVELRRKTSSWIANLYTKVRVNDFQTVNQQLPSFALNLHTFEIPYTGILWDNFFEATYYNYVYSDNILFNRDSFDSARIAAHPFLYRPFFFGPLTVTPEAGFIGIAYSDSPGGKSAGQMAGEFGVNVETAISRSWSSWKHVVEPYMHYNYLTTPRVPTDDHFIFVIDDGIDQLNVVRFGTRQSFFTKSRCGILRPLWIDVWANAFFGTHTIPTTIPKGYINVEWIPFDRLFCRIDSAWNFRDNLLDFFNIRLDYSVSPDLAFGVEYRNRSRYDWRKADFYNFILESVRSQQELLDSPLSDRRDTFLFRIFARPTPDWTAQFDLRYGWNRRNQPSYLEFQIELARIIFQHWRLAFEYEKREDDNRFSCSLLLQPGPPARSKYCR